jgi:hypothetical protein
MGRPKFRHSGFVSGHSFSDAISASKSDAPLGAGQRKQASCDGSHSAPFQLSVTCLLLGDGQGYRLVKVNRIRTTVVLGAVLLWAVTPALACLLPGFVPSPAERKCCQNMAGHCGQSAMPASHTCCQASNQPATLVVQAQANLPLKNRIAALPITHAHLSVVIAASSRGLAFSQSPPGQAPSGSSSVLRI